MDYKFLYLKKLNIEQKTKTKNIPAKNTYKKKEWFLNKTNGKYLLDFQ